MCINNYNKNYKKKRLILKLFKLSEYKKIIIEEIIDDKEEYLEANKIIIQVIIKIKPKFNEIAKSTPRYTAIPFPPLNFSQTGSICPRKHKRAER